MATVHPHLHIVAVDAADLAAVQSYLDEQGYVVGTNLIGARTDDAGALTIEVDYPTWVI